MKICVSQKQMQELEYDSIYNIGIPSIVLMERAALAVVDCVIANVDKSKHISVVCGKGNNGADGIAVARILWQQGYKVEIVTIGEDSKATSEYRIQETIAKNLQISFVSWREWKITQDGWIIDGIFGIGLKRDITGEYAELIRKIQEQNKIIAIDIPTGISADTGVILGCGIKAIHTVTFGYSKRGLYLNQGRNYAGNVHVANIGFHDNSVNQVQGNIVKILEESDLSYIPERLEDSNKGTYGKLLIVAGSVGMSGAAYLSAAAAYRMGAGLVKILTVEENREILQIQLPEAIVKGYTEENLESVVKQECEWASAVIIGPGLGQSLYVKTLVECVLKEAKNKSEQCKCITVLDSDALNTISNYPILRKYYGPHIVITPHMKEMSRLTERTISELKENPIQYAADYSGEHKITCVLKDAVSVIANDKGELYLTVSGNSALAKGGTGDVLTGMIGGLACIGMSEIESAAFGSYLHGSAGRLASEVHGKHCVMASELMNYVY